MIFWRVSGELESPNWLYKAIEGIAVVGLRNRRSEVRILSGALHETALASQMRCNPASRGRRRVGTGWNENAPRPASRGGSRRTGWRWPCGPRFSNLSLYHRAAAVGEAFTSSSSPAARSDPAVARQEDDRVDRRVRRPGNGLRVTGRPSPDVRIRPRAEAGRTPAATPAARREGAPGQARRRRPVPRKEERRGPST